MTIVPDRLRMIVRDAPSESGAFLAWAHANAPALKGFKVELSRGEVSLMMVQVTRNHATICSNLMRLLLSAVVPEKYLVTMADFGVRTPVGVRSPDILVDAGRGEGHDLAAQKPIFIAEVLSRSTTGIDFTEKRDECLSIESLGDYLICSQDEPRVWLWSRGIGGWPAKPTMIERREESFALAGLGIHLPMAEIYRGIAL